METPCSRWEIASCYSVTPMNRKSLDKWFHFGHKHQNPPALADPGIVVARSCDSVTRAQGEDTQPDCPRHSNGGRNLVDYQRYVRGLGPFLAYSPRRSQQAFVVTFV
jgi:hypothetical protein